MTLGWKLFVVFVAFCALMAGVLWMAFRERRLARALPAEDLEGQRASDARVLAVVFSTAIGGMLLTLLTAWLVFF
jgi:uncharacterized membrane protein